MKSTNAVSRSRIGGRVLLGGLLVMGSTSWVSTQPGAVDGAGAPATTSASPPTKPITLIRPQLAAPPAPAADVGRPVLPDQFVLLDGERELYAAFSRLASFPFEITPEMTTTNPATARQSVLDALPEDVKALEGRTVAVVGFMRPGTMEGGLVKDFLLVSHLDSCLGHSEPHLNHKVLVRMVGKGAEPVEKLPVAAVGTLRIAPMAHEGDLLFVYQMDADRVVPGNLIQFQ